MDEFTELLEKLASVLGARKFASHAPDLVAMAQAIRLGRSPPQVAEARPAREMPAEGQGTVLLPEHLAPVFAWLQFDDGHAAAVSADWRSAWDGSVAKRTLVQQKADRARRQCKAPDCCYCGCGSFRYCTGCSDPGCMMWGYPDFS